MWQPVPEHILALDFETFYSDEFTLKKLSTEAYIRDPRFEEIGIGLFDGEESAWLEREEFQAFAQEQDWSKIAILCHHTHFDGLIAALRFSIRPCLWLCTMSMGRALHGAEMSVGLGPMAKHYGVGEKGDEVVRARGKRRKDFTREEWLAYGAYCMNDARLTRGIFDKMVEQGFPESELLVIDTTIRMFTEPKFLLDEAECKAIIQDEQERKQQLLDRIGHDKSLLMSNDKFAELLADYGIEPPTKISLKTGKETWAFAKSDPGMKDMLEHEEDEIRWLAEARVGVKSTINESRAQRFLATHLRGGNIPVYLRYYAAHTGRKGGGDKMNMQNLERTSKKNPKKGRLRKALKAPRGKKIVAADSSQIEARKTAWLAGNDKLVQAFASGRDVYCEFASEVYGHEVTKADEIKRHVGKASILGLGYQMGWHRFASELMKGAQGGPPVVFTEADAEAMGVKLGKFQTNTEKMARVEAMPSRVPLEQRWVHCAVTEAIVWKYRNSNRPTTDLWDLMVLVIEAMLGEEEASFGPKDFLHTVRHGIMLPNGLVLRYPGLRPSSDGDGFSYMGGRMGKERVRCYGGSMTENVVQALARIIVMDQMVELRTRYGYDVVTTTHDEIVLMVDEDEAPRALARSLEVMRTPPKWAPGLPLNAEGGYAQAYGEAK